MGFPRQKFWSGLPFLSPRDLPDPGIKPKSPTLQADSLPSEPSGKLNKTLGWSQSLSRSQFFLLSSHKECWAPKNWCFPIVVLEKTLENPLNSKEIKPVNPKGNQPWIFTGRTDAETEVPVLQPLNAKSQLMGRNPDAGKDWSQKEMGVVEDEIIQ